MVHNTMDALEWLRKQLDGDENDLLREMVREFAQRLMAAEVDVLVRRRLGRGEPGADATAATATASARSTRGSGRSSWRSRSCVEGSYFPDWLLEPRRRAEKALVAVVAECYVRGVSTRRVDGLVKTLGHRVAVEVARCRGWPPSSTRW